jgi:hypothetical protein
VFARRCLGKFGAPQTRTFETHICLGGSARQLAKQLRSIVPKLVQRLTSASERLGLEISASGGYAGSWRARSGDARGHALR